MATLRGDARDVVGLGVPVVPPPSRRDLLRVVGPTFVAGVEVDDRRIVRATAPIVHFMLGWPEAPVRDYCAFRACEVRC